MWAPLLPILLQTPDVPDLRALEPEWKTQLVDPGLLQPVQGKRQTDTPYLPTHFSLQIENPQTITVVSL